MPPELETTPTLEQRRVVRGRLPGDYYVGFRRLHPDEFQPCGDGVLQASEQVLASRSPAGRVYQRLKRIVLGRRLATEMAVHERLTKIKALAVLSSDAISSVAYATEASLGVLILAGVAALGLNLLLTAAIVVLLVIVGTSYRQTIYAYPHGGGSYIVAHENLGMVPGLIAAAALMIDYVLTVSVSVSSGVDFLISAVPQLGSLDVILGVGCVLLILLVNLRGIRESGTIFAAPTYLFIAAFAGMIVVGVVHALLSPAGLLGATPPVASPAARGWSGSLQPVTLFLVLTAFASGCSAMTGTEAISNGIPAFKPPESRNAARTLIAMVTILALFFAGTSYLAWRFGIVPFADQQPTVDHQIAATVFTGGAAWFVYVIDFTTLLILVLAANTSFADFPRLSAILARDGFLPHLFGLRGDRLAFSVGIVVLGVLSSVLIVVFHGSTDALINLYALGVFVAFTLSQTGMVVHWYHLREQEGPMAGSGWRRSMVINAVGALTTGLVAVIIGISKFDRGAWIVVFLVPVLVLLFYAIHRHYRHVASETAVDLRAPAKVQPGTDEARTAATLTPIRPEEIRNRLIVPIAHLGQAALQGIAYARSITPFVTAVHIAIDAEDAAAVRNTWDAWAEGQRDSWAREAKDSCERAAREASWREQQGGLTSGREDGVDGAGVGHRDAANDERVAAWREGPQLVSLHRENGSVVRALLRFVAAEQEAHPGQTMTVIVPEYAPRRRGVLASLRALRLKLALYAHRGVVVANLSLAPDSRVSSPRVDVEHPAPSAAEGPGARVRARPEKLRHLLVVPIDTLSAQTLQSLAYARSIHPFVTAVHVAVDPSEEKDLRDAWSVWAEQRMPAWHDEAERYRAATLAKDDRARREKVAAAIARGPQLLFIESPYRSLVAPLVAYIDALREGNPTATITVVLPEFVPAHWWEHLLHNATAARLKLALYARPGIVVANVPYHTGSRDSA